MYVYKSMRVSISIYIYTLCAHSPHAHIYGGFLNWGYPQSIQVRVNHFGIETTMVTLGFTKVKGPTLVSFAAACRKIHHLVR